MSGRSSRESWMLLSFSSRQDSRSSIRSWAANQRWVLWRLEAGPITAHLAAVHVRHDLVHGVLGLQTVDIRTMGMNKDKRTLKGKTTQTSGIYTAVGYLKWRCLCWTSAAVVPPEQNTEIMLESTQRYGSMVSDEAPPRGPTLEKHSPRSHLVLQTIHRFHNQFSQSQRRPLLGQGLLLLVESAY